LVTALYTPEILAAAVALARFPPDPALPFAGEARSRSCGSTMLVRVALDEEGRVCAVGLAARACAVGQAAAALFAQGVQGKDRAALAITRAALGEWLGGGDAVPDWPGLDLLAPARRYPGRHGAILLPWDAALAAMPEPALAQPGTSG
jgi:NifU-like protein involved in Fe-S cluster formation